MLSLIGSMQYIMWFNQLTILDGFKLLTPMIITPSAYGREVNSTTAMALQPAAGHCLNFIITIVIMTLG